jgi:hypothetical protein
MLVSFSEAQETRMRISVIALVLACFCFSTVAQDGHLYSRYSYLNIETNGLSSRQNANGWETGVIFNINYWLGVESNAAGYCKTYSFGSNYGSVKVLDNSFGLGPRFNYRGFPLTTVFAHLLIGGDTLSGRYVGLLASQTGFATIFGGGVERSIGRSPWALRASADYAVTHHDIFAPQSYTQNNFRAAIGIKYSSPISLTKLTDELFKRQSKSLPR